MSEQTKPKIIKRAEIEKRDQQRRRAQITLLRLLIEEMPDEARRLVAGLHESTQNSLTTVNS